MYIHLGNNLMVHSQDIIGVFDLDSATISLRTRNFLSKAEKKGEVVSIGYDLPKSFVICVDKNKKKNVYLSQLSSSTLLKRTEQTDSFQNY